MLRGSGVPRGEVMSTSQILQPASALSGGSASRGDARWQDGSAIVMGNGGNSVMNGRMAALLQ
jgi:hypothetical protein